MPWPMGGGRVRRRIEERREGRGGAWLGRGAAGGGAGGVASPYISFREALCWRPQSAPCSLLPDLGSDRRQTPRPAADPAPGSWPRDQPGGSRSRARPRLPRPDPATCTVRLSTPRATPSWRGGREGPAGWGFCGTCCVPPSAGQPAGDAGWEALRSRGWGAERLQDLGPCPPSFLPGHPPPPPHRVPAEDHGGLGFPHTAHPQATTTFPSTQGA